MTLSGRVAVVTGGGQGLGRGIALRLAEDGADVAVVDLVLERAASVTAEIASMGRQSRPYGADVADYEQVTASVHQILGDFGRIDVLVNNAGMSRLEPFLEISVESWKEHLDVHVSGSFYFAQLAARDMATRQFGRIINMSSVAGMMGPIDLAPYGVAKAALTGLTRAAAVDLADYGITVNAIAPGPIKTAILSTWSPEALADRAQHLPVGRLGDVEDISRMASFLASPDASFITGAVFVVDGGSLAAGAYMVEKYRRHLVSLSEG